jgi:AcrR family transcriptional regulator
VPTSRLKRGAGSSSDETKRMLVAAAIDCLREHGFAGASARVIAQRAGCNQSLVFYHFGTVTALLLAALDQVSADRMRVYSAALDSATSLTGLIDTARQVFIDDLDHGNVAVLVEMIAGSRANPELAAQVAARLVPWKDFAADALADLLAQSPAGDLLSGAEAAHLTVGLYLGLEMLASIENDRDTVLELFDRARLGLGLLGLMRHITFDRPTTSPETEIPE